MRFPMFLFLGAILAICAPVAATRFPDDSFFTTKFASMCVSDPETVRWVLENHYKQLNRCNVRALKRGRTKDSQFFFGPNVIKGEKEVDELFVNFCKRRSEGGLKGIRFTEKHAFIVGNVISVQWVVSAPFLAEDYHGSDAYVTCGRKLLTIVSSFDGNELQFKEDM